MPPDRNPPLPRRKVVIASTPEGVATHAATTLRLVSRDAPGAVVRVALSGGSTPAVLYELLAGKFRSAIPWERLALFFGDERAVPPDHPDSNFGLAERLLFSKVDVLRPEQVRRMRADSVDLDQAAREYEAEIRRVVTPGDADLPSFDLVWLGVGTDGHTASLFPGSDALEETERLIVATQSPHTGATRMSFTLPLVNAARHVQFLVTGTSKAEAVASILQTPVSEDSRSNAALCPAARVFPDGELEWVLDAAAAAELQRDLLA